MRTMSAATLFTKGSSSFPSSDAASSALGLGLALGLALEPDDPDPALS